MMSVNFKKYDFGPELPSGLSIPDVIKYQISVSLGLPGKDTFELELRHKYETLVFESFNTVLEHLIVHKSYNNIVSQGLDAIYTSYIPGNSELDDIYVQSIKSCAEKIKKSKSHVHNPDQVYITYLAASIIIDQLKRGLDSCEKYIGMLPFSIVTAYGDHRARSEFLDQETVLKMYTNGLLEKVVYDALDNPENIAQLVRRVYFRTYANTLLRIKKSSIFNAFSANVTKNKYPDLDVLTILKDQVSQLSYSDKNNLIDRVYKLYELGIIHSNVDIAIPNNDIVNNIESQNIAKVPPHDIKLSVVNFADTKLNYTAHNKELYIDTLYFPTILHYIYYILMGKKYTSIFTNGKFIQLPNVSSEYVLIKDVTKYFNRAVFCNEIHGLGDKYVQDIYTLQDSDYQSLVNGVSPLDDEISELVIVASQLLKRNSNLVKLKKVLPAAISWVESRMDIAYYIYNIIPIRNKVLTDAQINALYNLISGSCISSTSKDIFTEVKKELYVYMRDILLKNSLLTPTDVMEYARRVVSPKTDIHFPREISSAVIAIKYILDKLVIILGNVNSEELVQYAFKILSEKEIHSVVYDDYTELISKELHISDKAAALIRGFIDSISKDDDVTYRRIVFYSSMS